MELLKFEQNIYRQLYKYFSFYINRIPKEDVMQEIRISILAGGDVVKVASKNLRLLIRGYGYSLTLGKDNFDIDRLYSNSDQEHNDYVDKTYNTIKTMYLEEKKTAKQICEDLGVEYTKEIGSKIAIYIGGKRGKNGYNKKQIIPFTDELAHQIVSLFGIRKTIIPAWRYNGNIPRNLYIKMKNKPLPL